MAFVLCERETCIASTDFRSLATSPYLLSASSIIYFHFPSLCFSFIYALWILIIFSFIIILFPICFFLTNQSINQSMLDNRWNYETPATSPHCPLAWMHFVFYQVIDLSVILTQGHPAGTGKEHCVKIGSAWNFTGSVQNNTIIWRGFWQSSDSRTE